MSEEKRSLTTKIKFEAEKEPLENIEKTLESLHEKLELFAGIEIVKKLFEMSEAFAHWGEELAVTSENIGITVEAMQELSFAAEQSGVSSEMMGHSLALLSRRIYEAKTGSVEAAETFRKAGFTVEQISSFKNAEDAFSALADKIKGIEDPMKRAAVAQELAGRGGYQMVALLSKGGAAIREQGEELRKLGLVLSGPQVEAIEKLEHAFQRLHALFHAFGAQIVSTIGPSFTYLIDVFIKLYSSNKDLISSNLINWLHGLEYVLGFVAGVVIGLVLRFKDLAKSFGIENDVLSFISTIAGAVSALFGLAAVLKIIKTVFDFFIEGLAIGLKPFIGILSLVKNGFVFLASQIAIATESTTLFNAAVWVSKASLLEIFGAVGLLVFAFHELFELLTGGKTWTKAIANWLDSIKPIHNILISIYNIWASISGNKKLTLDVVGPEDYAPGLQMKDGKVVSKTESANTVPDSGFNFSGALEGMKNAMAGLKYTESGAAVIPGIVSQNSLANSNVDNGKVINQTNNYNITTPSGTDNKHVADTISSQVVRFHQEAIRTANRPFSQGPQY